MKKKLENRLNESLQRLDKLADGLEKTAGYQRETGILRLLKELMKEQIKNENTRYTNNPTR